MLSTVGARQQRPIWKPPFYGVNSGTLGHETYLLFDFEPSLLDHCSMAYRNRYVQTQNPTIRLKQGKTSKGYL